MNLPRWAKPAAIGVSIIAGSGGAYYFVYARPLGRANSQLSEVVTANNELSAALRDRTRVQEQLKAMGARVLSPLTDEADARFRSLLSDIAVSAGLSRSSVQVNTEKPERMMNPAGTSKMTTRLKDDLKKQIDFSAIKGELTGTGSLEAAMRAMATVRAQAWVHRIESFSIKPEDRDRQKFTLRITLYTMFVPDLTPSNLAEPVVAPIDNGGKDRWAGIVQKNVFKEPAPLVVAAAPPTPDPAPVPAPKPAFEEWKLTGITEGRSGISAMLVNVKSKQSLILQVGAAVADARFVGGQGERATFEIGGALFEVFNGQTLEQRRPATR